MLPNCWHSEWVVISVASCTVGVLLRVMLLSVLIAECTLQEPS